MLAILVTILGCLYFQLPCIPFGCIYPVKEIGTPNVWPTRAAQTEYG